MGNSKIVYYGETLIDLTGDTVEAAKLLKGVTAHDKAGNEIVGTLTRKRVFSSKTVDVSEFSTDSTYADYPYRAAIALSGITSAFTPYVMFSEEDAATGIFSRNADSYAGGVYIYANKIPSAAVAIDEIICIEE